MKKRHLKKWVKTALLIILFISIICLALYFDNKMTNDAYTKCIQINDNAPYCEDLR